MTPNYRKKPKGYDEGGEVDDDSDDSSDDSSSDDSNKAKPISTEMQSPADVPQDSPLRIKTSFDTYAKGGKVEKVMKEYKEGELHSGSKKGPVVTDRKQAEAIALNEQRNMSEGGEMSDDDAMDDAMGEEFMNAVHSKDKKGIMSALTAIARSRKMRSEE